MNVTKVWAVASGEYSDYSVGLLFTTEALAQEYCDTRNAGNNSKYGLWFTEEFTLLDAIPPRAELWQGGVYSNGKEWARGYVQDDLGVSEEAIVPRWFETGRVVGHVEVSGYRSREAALKAAHDAAARARAEAEGIA